MKSSRFAVASHVLVVLAEHDETPVPSADIARSVNTNPAFVRQLSVPLRKAGLVQSVLGPGGGMMLARPASEITLAAVYDAVEEEPLLATHHCEPGRACFVGRNILEALDPVLEGVEGAVRAELSKHSVSSLLRAVQRLDKKR
ncbi:MAG: Rrf2 family transcriptional regulator [Myxococcales bacterium]|nr:Rrf2 family transcriptional regulator [Myxococcales bacterium]